MPKRSARFDRNRDDARVFFRRYCDAYTVDSEGTPHALVVGAGEGLVLAALLLELGWKVTLVTDDRIGKATLWRVAAGLVELIGVDPSPELQERGGYLDIVTATTDTLAWYLSFADYKPLGVDAYTVDFYGETDAEIGNAPNSGLSFMPGYRVVPSDHPNWTKKCEFETVVVTSKLVMRNVILPVLRHGAALDRFTLVHRHMTDRDEVDRLAEELKTDVTVIAAGINNDDFRETNTGHPGVGLVIRHNQAPAPGARITMTSDLTYEIWRRYDRVLGGNMAENFTAADLVDFNPARFPELGEEVLRKLFRHGIDIPQTNFSVAVGARPMDNVGPYVTADHSRARMGSERLTLTIGGLAGAGWTLLTGVLDASLVHITKHMT